MLGSMDGKDSDWFKSQLKQGGCDEPDLPVADVEGRDEQAVGYELAALEEVDANLAPVVVPLQARVFVRTDIDIGEGLSSLRLYFDNFNGQGAGSHKQRGFCNCRRHGCIKYVPVGAMSYNEYCPYMYAWWVVVGDTAKKVGHLQHVPSSEAVADIQARLRLTPF